MAAHLLADRGAPLFDGLLLALHVGLDPRDAPIELLDAHGSGRAARVDAVGERAGSLEAFAQGVVEHDAPALLGEERR